MLAYDYEQRLFPHWKYSFQRITPRFINFIVVTEEKKWEMMAADVYSVGTNSVFIKYRYRTYLQL